MEQEQVLVEYALKGDTGAFEKLVQMYQDRLFQFLMKMVFSRQDAEEILQEVFIRAYKYLYRYNNRWKFSTWIYQIALNVCRSEMKKRKRSDPPVFYDDLSHLPGDASENPENIYSIKERHAEILELINGLKEKQRIPLILKYVKGFSYHDIARIAGISAEAAKMKVMRAKETICNQYFEKHRGDCT